MYDKIQTFRLPVMMMMATAVCENTVPGKFFLLLCSVPDNLRFDTSQLSLKLD
jgi:hypothetical protein